jgi:hypothetical protein
VNAKNNEYDIPLHARLKMGAQVLFYFGRFKSLVLVVDSLLSILPLVFIASRFVDCSWRRKLTWGPRMQPPSGGLWDLVPAAAPANASIMT